MTNAKVIEVLKELDDKLAVCEKGYKIHQALQSAISHFEQHLSDEEVCATDLKNCQEIKLLQEQIDQLRVQLAGCGIAASGYTMDKGDLCKKGDYGWSASFQDCQDLWDKYIKLKDQLERVDDGKMAKMIFNFDGYSLYSMEDCRELAQAICSYIKNGK